LSKRFSLFFVAGLAVVAVLLLFLFTGTKGAHLRLEGKVLKVRVLALSGSAASLVMVDFRATNPSDVPFVVNSVKLKIDSATGETVEGVTISKPDIDNVFQYAKLLGPKYNDVLSLRDRIMPHQSADRMVGARFEMPEPLVNSRKALRLEIEDVDGAVAVISETPGLPEKP
jgi:hypothetical protein